MTRQYRAEFDSDMAVLMFLAENQEEAIKTVCNHAHEGEEFTLQSRGSSTTPWEKLKRISVWRVGYGLEPCRRIK